MLATKYYMEFIVGRHELHPLKVVVRRQKDLLQKKLNAGLGVTRSLLTATINDGVTQLEQFDTNTEQLFLDLEKAQETQVGCI